MSADPHATHASAVADPHDSHGAAGGSHGAAAGHGHDEAPTRTPVPPFEATPWGMIALGILVIAAVVGAGLARNWGKWIQENPNKVIGAPGHGPK
jgi:hypothetical protein